VAHPRGGRRFAMIRVMGRSMINVYLRKDGSDH
jgi:hypothetical protein